MGCIWAMASDLGDEAPALRRVVTSVWKEPSTLTVKIELDVNKNMGYEQAVFATETHMYWSKKLNAAVGEPYFPVFPFEFDEPDLEGPK